MKASPNPTEIVDALKQSSYSMEQNLVGRISRRRNPTVA